MPRVVSMRRMPQGDLRAFATVQIGSVLLHDFRVVQQAGQRPYVQPPQRTYTDGNGKLCYGGPVVELPEGTLKRVQEVVLAYYVKEGGGS